MSRRARRSGGTRWLVLGVLAVLAYLAFTGATLVWQLVMIALSLAGVAAWVAAKGDKAGLASRGLWGAVKFAGASTLTFGAMLFRTQWGRVAAFAAGALILADMSWGADTVEFPVLGWFWLGLAGLVMGGVARRRRERWEVDVIETVRAAVPGYTQGRDPVVSFGSGTGISARLGRYANSPDFSFRVPKTVRSADLVEIEEHFRDVAPIEEGASLGIEWNLRSGVARARLIDDLPTSITVRDLDGIEASAAGYAPGETRETSHDPTVIPYGVTRSGIATWDCSNLYGSMMICGAPGGGKSCAIRTVLHHCMRHPTSWDVYLIDPKRVEFGPMRKYPVVREVATDLGSAARVLEAAREEMKKRYAALEELGVQNIHELNDLLAGAGRRRQKHVMVVVDELAELVELSEGKDPESKAEDALKGRVSRDINSLSRLGRAAGFHLIPCTQRPDATILSGATKSNIQQRIAMGGLSRTGSEMAIESSMAANLPGISGRGISYRSGDLEEVQVFYTSMADLDAVAGMAA